MSVVPIHASLVNEVWDEAAPLINKALLRASGRFELEDVKEALLEQQMSLVLAFDGGQIIGAIVAEVIDYPRCRAMRVIFCGGERYMEYRDELIDVLDAGARNAGCSLIEIEGRPGWEKYLKGKATKISTVLEREVTHERTAGQP